MGTTCKTWMWGVNGELLHTNNGNLSKYMEHMREAFGGYNGILLNIF